VGFSDTKGGGCSTAKRQMIRSSGISATLLRRHKSPGAFALSGSPDMQGPCHQQSGLAGMGCSTSSPAPFGDTQLIPKAWEPVPALFLPIPLLALCCQQPLLLELPVNPRYLSCSACCLHLKRASSEKQHSDQTAFLGSKAFTVKTFQRKEVLNL